MITVIPAILAQNFREIAKKLERIKKEAPSVEWVQLDIMDGQFVPNTTWNNPEELSSLASDLSFEVHLMVKKPAQEIDKWCSCPTVKRILFHREAVDAQEMVQALVEIKEKRREGGIVLNPATSLETIKDHLVILEEVMFMGVEPGFSGQSLQTHVLNKIKVMREMYPAMPIGIDGGVNAYTARELILAGATRLYAASYLWESENLQNAIDGLVN
jgi:ribulose-phosphate 3-epimerase